MTISVINMALHINTNDYIHIYQAEVASFAEFRQNFSKHPEGDCHK